MLTTQTPEKILPIWPAPLAFYWLGAPACIYHSKAPWHHLHLFRSSDWNLDLDLHQCSGQIDMLFLWSHAEKCFSNEVGVKEGAEGFRIWLGLISDDVLVKLPGGCEGWLGLLLLSDIIVQDAIYFSFEEDQISRFLPRQNSRVGGKLACFVSWCTTSITPWQQDRWSMWSPAGLLLQT